MELSKGTPSPPRCLSTSRRAVTAFHRFQSKTPSPSGPGVAEAPRGRSGGLLRVVLLAVGGDPRAGRTGYPPLAFPDSNKSGFAVLQAISSTSTFSATEGWAALWSVRPSAFNRLLQFVGEAGHVGVEVGVVRHVQKHAAAHVEPWATRFAEYAEPTTLVDPDVSAVDFPFWPAADEVMMRVDCLQKRGRNRLRFVGQMP